MDPAGEINQITSQVSVIDATIHSLHIKRVALLHRLNFLQSPVISKLPPETLVNIFQNVISLPESSLDNSGPDTRHLFKIGAVCSHWRRIAWSSPRLWDCAVLRSRPPHSNSTTTDYVSMMRCFYQNSGHLPMSIYIAGWKPETTVMKETIQLILEKHPARLKSLHLDDAYRHRDLWMYIFRYGETDTAFPQLEELSLCWDGAIRNNSWYRLKPRIQPAFLFRNSPRLRRLALSIEPGRVVPLEFSWNQLTEVKLNGATAQYSLDVLALCPNLVSYHSQYESESGNYQPHPPRDSVTLENLQRFSWVTPWRMREFPSDHDASLFTSFRLPAVRELVWGAPLPSNTSAISSFFMSMQHLKRLNCLLPSCWQRNITLYWDLFDTISELRYSDKTYSPASDHIYRLAVKAGKEVLMPRLDTLHLILAGSVSPESIFRLVHSRRNGPIQWSYPEQEADGIVFSAYDPTSSHWQHHARLKEFSVSFAESYVNWNSIRGYDALKEMAQDAKIARGLSSFGDKLEFFW